MKKVVVIEDNRDNFKIIAYALERAGYTVIGTEFGVEGVRLALEEDPRFIIMDINLPDIDGIEATQRIRESKVEGQVPIVAITSYALTGDRERILAAGCNGYIEKPIDPINIVEQIHNIIGYGDK